MPQIIEEKPYDGAERIIERLGLDELLAEVRSILTDFELRVLERKDMNGAGALRKILDIRFAAAGGWTKKTSGGIDWKKCMKVNSRRHVCIGVEIQVSGRSDLLSVDFIHLRNQLLQGEIDLAILVVPTDKLGSYLTDRVAKWSEAQRHIDMARAYEMPFVLMGIEHDGPADTPLQKKKYKR